MRKLLYLDYFSIIICLLFPVVSWSIDLELTDYDGKTHNLSELKGNWLVINYWATWCPPCLKEIPMLSDYHEEHQNVKVFGIHFEQDVSDEQLNDFKDTFLISYPLIPINKNVVRELGMAYALPMTVFISPEGDIVKKYTGLLTEKFLNRVIK